MTNLRIDNTTSSNLTTAVTDTSILPQDTDGATGQGETYYQNTQFTQQWGYFMTDSEYRSAELMKSIWVVGKGWTADPDTTVILDHVSGDGKDTFDDIIFNMDVMRRVTRNSYAEIIRADDKNKTLLNLKPLNGGTIKKVYGKDGRLIRYEQTSRTNKAVKTFKPEEIFELSNNRLSDMMCGISNLDGDMADNILASRESFLDIKRQMHTTARPMIIFKLGTDDTAKIAAFVAKMDAAVAKGENIYVPDDENSFSFEVVQANPSSMGLEWRNDLRKKFYRNIQLPELLQNGGGESTESGGKIGSLHWSQIIEREQRYIEQQIWAQLALRVNLLSPETISQDLANDQAKDGINAFQPSDMIAGAGR